jgi:uncharacterized SAM-binding protein YcdF (DUF218 family)
MAQTKAAFDAAIVLGGGRYNDGTLTPLSLGRLDRGIRLYRTGTARRLILLGGPFITYSPNAIRFRKTGAQVRKEYAVRQGVPASAVLKVESGRDTICEAFAARDLVRAKKYSRVQLVTSEKHLPRALWLFRRIFGKRVSITGVPVPSGRLLFAREEAAYFRLTKRFFSTFPAVIPTPNLSTWFFDHAVLYAAFKRIHDSFHPPGRESQAYAGVKR